MLIRFWAHPNPPPPVMCVRVIIEHTRKCTCNIHTEHPLIAHSMHTLSNKTITNFVYIFLRLVFSIHAPVRTISSHVKFVTKRHYQYAHTPQCCNVLHTHTKMSAGNNSSSSNMNMTLPTVNVHLHIGIGTDAIR